MVKFKEEMEASLNNEVLLDLFDGQLSFQEQHHDELQVACLQFHECQAQTYEESWRSF